MEGGAYWSEQNSVKGVPLSTRKCLLSRTKRGSQGPRLKKLDWKTKTQCARAYKVTSFRSTDCELRTETCSKTVYSVGPWTCLIVGSRCQLLQRKSRRSSFNMSAGVLNVTVSVDGFLAGALSVSAGPAGGESTRVDVSHRHQVLTSLGSGDMDQD